FIYAADWQRASGVLAEASCRVRPGRGEGCLEPVAGSRCSLRMAVLWSRLSQFRTALVLRLWGWERLEDGAPRWRRILLRHRSHAGGRRHASAGWQPSSSDPVAERQLSGPAPWRDFSPKSAS